jgi:hypothetical protein
MILNLAGTPARHIIIQQASRVHVFYVFIIVQPPSSFTWYFPKHNSTLTKQQDAAQEQEERQ